MKLLVTKGKLKNVEKLDKANRKYIEGKVDLVLKKRENKINEIQSKLDEDYYKKRILLGQLLTTPLTKKTLETYKNLCLLRTTI